MDQGARVQSWFLSYHTRDGGLAQQVEARLRERFPDLALFYAPKSIQAGSLLSPAKLV